MANKKMTVSLDGNETVLNLGVGRFYHLFKEATGYDLFDLGKGFDSSKMVDIVQGIVYAGYVSECKVNKTEVKYTKESIYDSVLDSDVAKIFREFNDLMNQGSEPLPEQNGQLKEASISSI